MSKWFPMEMRTYELPGGRIVDDFSVTTIADVAMIVPVTASGKIILVNQYKPGVDEIMIQFPAGRIEPNHRNMDETAIHELQEETGIKVSPDQIVNFGRLTGFSTKASEVVYLYLARNCEINSGQHLDENEEIEVLSLSPNELDQMMLDGRIWCGQTIAAWSIARQKFNI